MEGGGMEGFWEGGTFTAKTAALSVDTAPNGGAVVLLAPSAPI
jgi:hypothetical protein